MLDWLVVGGGPHGVHTALRLIEDGGVPRDAIRILDDEQRLLARWRRSTRNTGMRFLRSPGVHHIGRPSESLNRFACGPGRGVGRPFTRPYSRPALELFDLHCDDVIERHQLQDLHVRGRVNRLGLTTAGAQVGFEDLADGGRTREVEARHVILAIGAPREPAWPDWARRAVASAAQATEPDSTGRIRHLFDPGFELVDDANDAVIAVIGAGISGAQVALRLAREGRRVVLISRHGLRVQQFDSDPGWLGPKNMAGFSRLGDPDERRDRVRAARHRGSMPPEVHAALRLARADGTIELVEGAEVTSARVSGRGVWLELEGQRIRADRVLLATGFPSRRPGGAWLDEAVAALQLPCAACGYPIVDRALRWHPRLLVTGALAELELGPVSRNLSGAQRAAERIVATARSGRSTPVARPRSPAERKAEESTLGAG
ncbi:MAG: FAD/NAD(P)-binding protein [Myxococcota bacterium]|nr:FAD/NAD(P)-binding protein [Myxococcota bacterium]